MAAAEGVGHGSELEQIQARSRAVANKTLDATRHLLALTEESKEAGIQCLVALDDQGEKLDNIERGLNDVHSDMNTAKESLKQMEKWCGLCTLPWKRGPPKNKSDDAVWNGKNDGKVVVSSQPPRVMTDDRNACGPMTGYIGRITNDAMEDEMEECMVQVSTNIGNLRNMALDISSELENQNNQLKGWRSRLIRMWKN
ncbi:synaptosomal-associated protein 25-like [Leguminivora glycinivorella]|uniref:synaptosomal-associated protein 25-like n=1 Tax=Leguminivora glycinivorella TaxID=1035111 RepID=UPI00200CA11A|nr:synaptosomal-associated protein 25-like [Leguminivora glycinivorella]